MNDKSHARSRAQLERTLRPALERFLREQSVPGASASRRKLARRDATSAEALVLLERTGALRQQGEARFAGDETIRRLQLTKQGLPVFNRAAVLRERDGAPSGRSGWASIPPLRDGLVRVSREQATATALAHSGARALIAQPHARRGWLALGGQTLPVWRVIVHAQAPIAAHQIDIDATTGAVLGSFDLVRHATGQGSVYNPNIALSPTPSSVPLFDLDGSGRLSGSYARVFDSRATEAFVPSLQFQFPPSDPRFVQTSVYRGLTDMARWATARGFPAFPTSLPAFSNLGDSTNPTGEYNNAFYVGSPQLTYFGFGNGDGVITSNLGTDLDVAAHEMGHHFFEVLVAPSAFSSTDPIIAINEGIADVFAALLTGGPNIGESTIPGQPFLRTLANGNTFLNTFDPDPHTMGLIYGGASWDIAQAIGHNAFASVLLPALAQLPSDAYEYEFRDAVLAANFAVRGGANQFQLDAIFAARGFADTEFPPEFRGYLDSGIPAADALPDGAFHFYVFSAFPGASSVVVQTTGTGDVDLEIASFIDPNNYAFSGGVTSSETIVLGPLTQPSTADDDNWFVGIYEYPDGSPSTYNVTASYTLGPVTTGLGATVPGSITALGEIDWFLFEPTFAGQVARFSLTALTPGFDGVVAVLDPVTYELLGFDDDSGPGLDANIQGVLLPVKKKYAIAVLSFAGDFDPASAVGQYSLHLNSCTNTGANFDGDALVNACDDDDDNDTFVDSEDSAPLNAALCADFDSDSCDDCASGAWNLFADGADADTDGDCNLGDPDDDNDGCTDSIDPTPFTASADDDLDFLGADCDNCAYESNALQSDVGGIGNFAGADGIGDACQCGDVNGDGRVLTSDATIIQRALLAVPTATLAKPELCDVGGSPAGICNTADATIVKRALLATPTAAVSQVCAPALP